MCTIRIYNFCPFASIIYNPVDLPMCVLKSACKHWDIVVRCVRSIGMQSIRGSARSPADSSSIYFFFSMEAHLARMRELASSSDDPADAIHAYTRELDTATVQSLVAYFVRRSSSIECPANDANHKGYEDSQRCDDDKGGQLVDTAR